MKIYKTIISYAIKGCVERRIREKHDFLFRENEVCKEIMSCGVKHFYPMEMKFTKGLYLFRLVKLNVKAATDKMHHATKAKLLRAAKGENKLPTNRTSPDFDLSNKICKIDLNHAYWRVAYLKGYISDVTYKSGLKHDELKPIRLSALSSLGKSKVWDKYVKGLYDSKVTEKGNKLFAAIYYDIRQSTFKIMQKCAKGLKNDFYKYETDAISFADTKPNRLLVTQILKKEGIKFKIVPYEKP